MARSHRALVLTGVLAACVGGLGLSGSASSAPSTSTLTSAAIGKPGAGRALFGSLGCRGCHALTAGATVPTTGPPLTADGMRERARLRSMPLGAFVAEGIVSPDADVVPGYVSGVMRPYKELRRSQLDDLVSFLVGRPYTTPEPKLPRDPVGTCSAVAACRATVARWTRAARLPRTAIPGAKIVASVGCLSCHRYAGSGVGAPGPDLTKQGRRGRSDAVLLRRLRCPSCFRQGSLMPSYARLGDANLASVVAFLRASRGAAE
ncbi:MAG: cytochrome c [Gaiellaceae bacterium]